MTTMRRTRRGRLADAVGSAAALLAACGRPDSVVRAPVAGLTPDGPVEMREVQVAYIRGVSAIASGGTLFYRGWSQGAGKGEAGPSVAVEHAVKGDKARMLCRSDHAQPGRDRARPDGERRCFGAFAQDTAAGFAMRHDHGSQHMSNAFQRDLRFLGSEGTPACVELPEKIECAERFICAPKENLLWLQALNTVEEARRALIEFRKVRNAARLIERHVFRPPGAVRQDRSSTAALTA